MMSIIHSAGYIALTLNNGNTVTVKISKINAISTLGNDGVAQILFDGGFEITVREKMHEIFEKIDAYIAPELR
jgi:uncharacterized protein YlzI (FlbEa/FlbD family)